MKRVFFCTIYCFLMLFSLISEDIELTDVEDYSWEATVYSTGALSSDLYYFFDFNRRDKKVRLSIKDINDSLQAARTLQYREYFEEESQPMHIRIFSNDEENPLFVIEYGDNSEIIIRSADPDLKIHKSFTTLKSDYVRLKMQGIQNFDRVRVRTAPNLESRKIASLMKGDLLNIINRSAQRMVINDMDAFWFKVQTPDGLVGWTYGYFLELGREVYTSPEENRIIFQKTLALDQGASQRYLFYRNNEQIGDSGWIGSNKHLIFENEKRMITGIEKGSPDFSYSYNRQNPPKVYIFDFDGNIVSDFEISDMTIDLGKVNNGPLFYVIDSYGIDSIQKWSNRCFVYDLNGISIEGIVYNEDVSSFAFEYNGKTLKIELIEP